MSPFKAFRVLLIVLLVGCICIQWAICWKAVRTDDAFGRVDSPILRVLSSNNNNNNNTSRTADAVVTMPQISFPVDLAANAVFEKNQSNMAITISTSGGCESKLEVKFGSSEFIFKPSHGSLTADKGKFEFRPSKGGIVYLRKHHPPKILNELLAFTVDQILGLDRTPPVFPFEVSNNLIQQQVLLSTRAKTHQQYPLMDCNMDFSVAAVWLHHHDAVVGTLQYKLPHVEKLSKPLEFIRSFIGSSTATWFSSRSFVERERSTRTLFDYLIGNWDRSNNDFVHSHQPDHGHPRVLVYIDQNALSAREVPFALEEPLMPPQCRFYWGPVQELRDHVDFKEIVLERMLQNDLVSSWVDDLVFQTAQLVLLRNMNIRRQVLLDRVDRCIDLYGVL
jgi:hypothetical protein